MKMKVTMIRSIIVIAMLLAASNVFAEHLDGTQFRIFKASPTPNPFTDSRELDTRGSAKINIAVNYKVDGTPPFGFQGGSFEIFGKARNGTTFKIGETVKLANGTESAAITLIESPPDKIFIRARGGLTNRDILVEIAVWGTPSYRNFHYKWISADNANAPVVGPRERVVSVIPSTTGKFNVLIEVTKEWP